LINFNVPVLKNGISRKINTPKLIETRWTQCPISQL
jgi:hypothetical protein